MQSFQERVYTEVSKIPPGEIASYGDIATRSGSPRAARQVGWVLARLGIDERTIPWWRVVNKQGYLSIRGHSLDVKEVQKELLMGEGVEFRDEYHVVLK